MRRRPADLATRELRRDRIERLLVENAERSNRAIATEALSDTKTVARIRGELERTGRVGPRTRPVPTDHGGALLRPQRGNARAVQSGVHSEQRVGPLRDAEMARLRERWPGEDADEIEIAASRKARLRLFDALIDRVGVHTQRGLTAAVERGKVEAALERQLQRFAKRARERSQAAPEDELAAEIALIHAARANGDE